MLALVTLSLVGCASSQIRPDESVLFFPTVARRAADGTSWTIPVHGWIFEREESSESRAALQGLVRAALGVPELSDDGVVLQKRIAPFLWDSERGKRLSVSLCGKELPLEVSGPNGHFEGSLTLSAAEVKAASGQGGGVTFRALVPAGDSRAFQGVAILVEPKGLSIVSDIDDTIKVSEVTNRKALLENTFLREFRAIPGMAEVYSAWSKAGASFHYVSASPWQLYEPLAELLSSSGFPAGSFHMKQFRLKDSSFFDLFASPVDYKRRQIDALLEAFPERKFVLVGDSGERDPEIYAAIAIRFPDQVARILIRDVTGEGPDSERMKKAFEGAPREKWKIFRDADELGPRDVPAPVKRL